MREVGEIQYLPDSKTEDIKRRHDVLRLVLVEPANAEKLLIRHLHEAIELTLKKGINVSFIRYIIFPPEKIATPSKYTANQKQ